MTLAMKRVLSRGELSSSDVGTECDGDQGAGFGFSSGSSQQRPKRSRKTRATIEQLNAIDDTIDHVISQITDGSNSVESITPPVSSNVLFMDITERLMQQQTVIKSIELKIDSIAEVVQRIYNFLGLPTTQSQLPHEPSCGPLQSTNQTDHLPAGVAASAASVSSMLASQSSSSPAVPSYATISGGHTLSRRPPPPRLTCATRSLRCMWTSTSVTGGQTTLLFRVCVLFRACPLERWPLH